MRSVLKNAEASTLGACPLRSRMKFHVKLFIRLEDSVRPRCFVHLSRFTAVSTSPGVTGDSVSIGQQRAHTTRTIRVRTRRRYRMASQTRSSSRITVQRLWIFPCPVMMLLLYIYFGGLSKSRIYYLANGSSELKLVLRGGATEFRYASVFRRVLSVLVGIRWEVLTEEI